MSSIDTQLRALHTIKTGVKECTYPTAQYVKRLHTEGVSYSRIMWMLFCLSREFDINAGEAYLESTKDDRFLKYISELSEILGCKYDINSSSSPIRVKCDDKGVFSFVGEERLTRHLNQKHLTRAYTSAIDNVDILPEEKDRLLFILPVGIDVLMFFSLEDNIQVRRVELIGIPKTMKRSKEIGTAFEYRLLNTYAFEYGGNIITSIEGELNYNDPYNFKDMWDSDIEHYPELTLADNYLAEITYSSDDNIIVAGEYNEKYKVL